MNLKVGDEASMTKTITAKEINAFADLVGDHNPIHVDPEFAANTPFKKCIAHGMLGTSLVSTVLATKLPGPGTIYLSQNVQFKKPVFVDDTITVSVKVKEIREDKPIVTLESTAVNQRGEIVINGEAVVLKPRENN